MVAQPDLQSVEEDREQGAKLAERMLGEVGVLDHTEAWTPLDHVATRLVGGLADPRFEFEFPDGWLKVKTPRAVGAVQPDGYGFVFIGIQARGDDPGPAARAFVSGFNEEFGLSPSEERDFEIGAWPAHLATYADTSGSEEMHLHFVWVAGDGLVFKLIAAAPDRFRSDLAATAMSLRTVTDAERRSVRLRIATARPDESIADLGRRTGNTWNATETALANALDPAVRFKGDELVKIARSEAYR